MPSVGDLKCLMEQKRSQWETSNVLWTRNALSERPQMSHGAEMFSTREDKYNCMVYIIYSLF